MTNVYGQMMFVEENPFQIQFNLRPLTLFVQLVD